VCRAVRGVPVCWGCSRGTQPRWRLPQQLSVRVRTDAGVRAWSSGANSKHHSARAAARATPTRHTPAGQQVGYCQGMAFAAGVLLMYLPEEPAFR
jgi:hypothetical protein